MAPESAPLGGRSGEPSQGPVALLRTGTGISPQRSAADAEVSLLARLVDGQLALARCEADPDTLNALFVRLARDLVDADGAAIEHVEGDEVVAIAAHGILRRTVGDRR